MSADEIFIHNLVVQTIIGIFQLERVNQQPIELDIALKTNIVIAAESENLADTIDYGALVDGLSSFVESTQFLLIETLAESIVSWLWNFSPMINEVTLELRKPMAVLRAKTVGLRITRTR
jgi:7,8-dihydroneopterin aldolase/epimerase/oxygenase